MFGSTCKIFASNAPDALQLVSGSFNGKGFLLDMSVCRSTMELAIITPSMFPQRVPGDGVLFSMPTINSHDVSNLTGFLAGTEDTQPLETWHMRLGHLNQASIQQLTTRATGLHIGPARPQTLNMKCDSCLRGSQHKSISRFRSANTTRRLQHVWTDIKGPLLAKDIHGFRYMVVFVDEFTRWTEEYPMLTRSDLFNVYKLYEARMERITGERILNLHADGKYIGNDLRTHLRNHGVALLLTQPYAPQMNSLAERMIRTVIEHASAMLWCAMLPVGFWACATKCSVFLLNRSPASSLPEAMTPYEAWYGQKPNLGFLKVFGCRAAAHVPDELRTKTDWTSKSSPCIFVGYSETENLYELWDVEKATIIRKRDVVFWEHQMGHPLLHPTALPHGVSILPSIAGGVVASDDHQTHLPIPSSAPPNTRPLSPRPGRQSITKLPSEPTISQQNKSGELTFIPYIPPENAQAICVIDHSQTESKDPFAHSVYLLENLALLENAPPPEDIQPEEVFYIPRSEVLTAPRLDTDRLPKTYKQALQHPRASEWKTAMEAELTKLRDNDTWELVQLPPGRRAFPNKWVFGWKNEVKVSSASGDPKQFPKARLVARGDLQKEGLDYDQTFAPVIKCVSLRIILTYAASRKMRVHHWDIVSAFLHGPIDLEIYMQQPQGFSDRTNRVCKLNKEIYGHCKRHANSTYGWIRSFKKLVIHDWVSIGRCGYTTRVPALPFM